MQSRLLKQLIYGTFYLAIIFGIGYFFYLPFSSPPSCFDGKLNQSETEIDCGGSCQPCELKRLKPISVSPIALLDAGEGRLSLTFELRNPNTNFGADYFSYTVNFYDAEGVLIDSIQRESFIYPGEIKTMVEAGLPINPAGILRAEAGLSDFSWESVQEFSLPAVQTRDIKIEVREAERRVIVSGLLVNQNSFKLSRAVISAVIASPAGIRLGASETLLQDIQAFEEREFTISIPNIDPAAVSREQIQIGTEVRR